MRGHRKMISLGKKSPSNVKGKMPKFKSPPSPFRNGLSKNVNLKSAKRPQSVLAPRKGF